PLALSQLATALRLTPSAVARSAWDIPTLTRAVRMRVLIFIVSPAAGAPSPGHCRAARTVILTCQQYWHRLSSFVVKITQVFVALGHILNTSAILTGSGGGDPLRVQRTWARVSPVWSRRLQGPGS